MPNKAFLEITNACNLACDFCHGTKRPRRFMSIAEFTEAAEKLRGFADYLYFHLMGEPLLHPMLDDFLHIAEEMGFRVILTTNGTLLAKCAETLLASKALHKVSISLHAYEANAVMPSMDAYLADCFDFCDRAAQVGKIAVMRLWNLGGKNTQNDAILQKMHARFDAEASWKPIYSGFRIKERIYLEWGEKFDWPDENAAVLGENHTCYALRDQVGVLVDGTVVPCCLDADGAIALGNLFNDTLEHILASERAVVLRRSLAEGHVREPLCLRCGFAHGKWGR